MKQKKIRILVYYDSQWSTDTTEISKADEDTKETTRNEGSVKEETK